MYKVDDLISFVPLNLTLAEVEDAILKLMTSFPPERKHSVDELVPKNQLIKFLTFGAEVFRLGSTLTEFVVKDRCVVVSDLHGSLDDLVVVLRENGPPPDSQYLFLGDYVGRGKQQIEVFLIIMLMKLRWPRHIHMLRGVHECGEQCTTDTFFDTCMDAYNDRKICALFSQIFDYMPIAAIVNDKLLCCHGGVSQWMTSRDAIRSIKRPIVLYSMSILQSCLFTDILWADPDPNQAIPFQVSPRRCSYTFNIDGLRTVLHSVNCEALLRGNQDYEGGICVNFPGKCITVHTTNSKDLTQLRAAYLTIIKKNDRLDVDCSHNTFNRCPLQPPGKLHYAEVMSEVVGSYRKLKYKNYFNKLSRKNLVEHVIVNDVAGLHFVTSDIMRNWLTTYAVKELGYLPAFQEGGQGLTKIADYAHYFPVIFDAVKALKGTYRVYLSDEEINFITRASTFSPTVDTPISYRDWPLEPFDIKNPKEQDIQSRIKSLSHVWEPLTVD